VPDSQEDAEIEGAACNSGEVADALVALHATKVSTFQSEREVQLVSKLMLPVMVLVYTESMIGCE
jgi:hypothetical protein